MTHSTRPITQADALLVRARRFLWEHRRRAKQDGVTLDYGLTEIRQLIESNPCCRWCRLPVGYDLSLDHERPIARGGKHQLENLAVVCRRCNALKGQLSGPEMLELQFFLIKLHPVARTDLERRLLAGGKRYGG